MALNPNFDQDVAGHRFTEIESLLDGWLEHASHAMRALELMGRHKPGVSWPPESQGAVGSVEYHLPAFIKYAKEAYDLALTGKEAAEWSKPMTVALAFARAEVPALAGAEIAFDTGSWMCRSKEGAQRFSVDLGWVRTRAEWWESGPKANIANLPAAECLDALPPEVKKAVEQEVHRG